MQSIELDDILYRILSTNTGVTGAISGDVYVMGERPENSKLCDVVINTLSAGGENRPQIATSNVNIHVPDLKLTIGGQPQRKADRETLRTIVAAVKAALKSAQVEGLTIALGAENTIREVNAPEHYANIRVEWYIPADPEPAQEQEPEPDPEETGESAQTGDTPESGEQTGDPETGEETGETGDGGEQQAGDVQQDPEENEETI